MKDRSGLRNLRWCALCALAFLLLACGGREVKEGSDPNQGTPSQEDAGADKAGAQEEGRTMKLSSTAFQNGGMVPKEYTGDGADLSPPLAWTDPPEGTVSFALICDDPDAPIGTWVHWVVYRIPPDCRGFYEGTPTEEMLPEGIHQGKNDFRKTGYGGPAPPPGKPHRYFFRLFALDVLLPPSGAMSAGELRKAMEGHVLAQADLMGRYGR